MSATQPTIAAIATAPGRGGVGVIRLSGKTCCLWRKPSAVAKRPNRVPRFTPTFSAATGSR